MKLYSRKAAVIATTIALTGMSPPAAWLITLAAPFSMLAMLMVRNASANTMYAAPIQAP